MEQLDIGHAIAVAALRVTHIGLAAGVQVLFGDGVLGAAEQALGGVGGIVVGAIEEHAEAQGDAQFRWGLPSEPLFAGGGGRRGRGNCVAGITAWKGSPFQVPRQEGLTRDQQPIAGLDLAENVVAVMALFAAPVGCAAFVDKFQKPRKVVEGSDQRLLDYMDGNGGAFHVGSIDRLQLIALYQSIHLAAPPLLANGGARFSQARGNVAPAAAEVVVGPGRIGRGHSCGAWEAPLGGGKCWASLYPTCKAPLGLP
ncbi:hypothetical protein FQZ97_608200 [compost metagenome]